MIGAVVGSLAVVKRFTEDPDSSEDPVLAYIMEVPPEKDQCDYWDPIQAAAAVGSLDILEYLFSRFDALKKEAPEN
jgi:hypothetical protein